MGEVEAVSAAVKRPVISVNHPSVVRVTSKHQGANQSSGALRARLPHVRNDRLPSFPSMNVALRPLTEG